MLRVVVDSNVLLSALRGGRMRPLLEALIAGRFHLLTSQPLIRELTEVLARPEWREALDPSECQELLTVIDEAAMHVTPTRRVMVCRDPEDNAILDCALAGRADYIVTGDNDLLVLHPFHGIEILRPSEFLRVLSS